MHLFAVVPRPVWYQLGCLAIVISHGLLFTYRDAVELLPVVVTAVCIMCSQRHIVLLCCVAVATAMCVGVWQWVYALPTLSTWLVAAADVALGAARLTFLRSPLGPRRAQQRLSHRLRRQSEKLQAAIEHQASTHRTVKQFESDRRALLEHLPLHVVQKDMQGRFTFVSKSFCELVDRPLEDILGKTDLDLFSADSAGKYITDDKRVISTGEVFNDVESTPLPSGEMSFMQVRKAPLLSADGSIVGVQGIFWDVTEEFTRRKALQRIESLAHALIHAALDAVLIADDEGRVLEANPASESILGITAGQTAAHPSLAEIMHPSVEELAGRSCDPPGSPLRYQRRAPINEVLRAATGKRIEARLRRASDDWFEAEISAHPLDVEGKQNWAIFIRDITKRKNAERELRAAKETAEQANATKSEFVANVSHELRTPLTGIIGLHELLAASNVDQRQRNYLELARVSAGNLLTLIDDLLDFSKIEAGHVEIESIEFSLVECVEAVALALAARSQLRGLELLIDWQTGLPERLCGDPQRIKQILLNMLGNAIKFTEKGDIRIRVLRGDPQTLPSPSRHSDLQRTTVQSSSGDHPFPSEIVQWFRFEVHDSGIGIEAHQRELIFEAFRQADASTTRRYGGTGLGLTICRDLVSKMGGNIGIDDARHLSGEVRQGSCFYFELPLRPSLIQHNTPSTTDGKTPPQQSEWLPANFTATYRVVLAASDCPWQELLLGQLQYLGFEVTCLSIKQLAKRQPAQLFAAGNHTIVIADYRELAAQQWTTAPVVCKWVLLTTLVHAQTNTPPPWLSHAQFSWLSRPICRHALAQALSLENHQTDNDLTPAVIPSRRSATLLLVEDSPISQTVLQDMLQSLGHRVQIASNGSEAITACGQKMFDLVLMDIQMPDMDGLEATRAIRHAELSSHRRQSIYALTAHATNQDRLQCEAANMDGFLVKPISRDRLAEAIQHATSRPPDTPFAFYHAGQVPSSNNVTPPQRTVEPSVRESATLENVAAVERVLELDPHSLTIDQAFDNAPTWPKLIELMHDNESLLRDVLSLLVREAPKLGRSFQIGLEQGNFNETRRAVHTLKSNVRYVGLTQIGQYAQWLEYLARDQQQETLQSHAANLAALADAVADWADQQLRDNATS